MLNATVDAAAHGFAAVASPSSWLTIWENLDRNEQWGVLSAVAIAYTTWKLFLQDTTKAKVPVLGGRTGLLTSYLVALKNLNNGNPLLPLGYKKYKNKFFQVPAMDKWMVLIAGGPMVDELRKAPDDQLSFEAAVSDQLQTPFTLGKQIDEDMYHVPIIRSQLTRNLAVLFPEVQEEIVQACEDEIGTRLQGNEWLAVPALDTVMRIVSRASNRIFVGLPKCRDPDYRDLNITFTKDVAIGGAVINLFPKPLKPIAAQFMTNVPGAIKRAERHLVPIIEERRALPQEEWPNDMLSWLMEAATGNEATSRSLTLRMLTINFAAIHTSSMSFTHALFYLAANPEKYLGPLRAEVEAVVAAHGWEKISMQRMRKLDSFLKEAQRMNGLGNISMTRKALVDYTFADGTFIPKGTLVSALSGGIHKDGEIYPNPREFDGFRFSEMRDEEGEGIKHQMVSTSNEYLPFGHGRHACPGRFFAVNELKCVLAHLILMYDIKLEQEGVRPPDRLFANACVPNPTAKVMFRRRQAH